MTTLTGRPLTGKVAIVAGATRGAGRGIARMLGEAGATVYCTGRSTHGSPGPTGRPETIEETAELVTMAGGLGIAVPVDHSYEQAVAALVTQVCGESQRIDMLVNDIWGGDELTDWQPFWTLETSRGFAMLDRAVRTHIITSRHVAPVLVAQKSGLIVEVTDGDHAGYRGSLFYDLAKNATIRLAFAMAEELRPHGATALAVTPGFLRSEEMLDRFGVSASNWRDAIPRVQGFEASETPCFVGRGVAALGADPQVRRKTGGVYASWTLAREYGFADIDGEQPDWGAFVERSLSSILARGGPTDAKERLWLDSWYGQLRDAPQWQPLMNRIRAARAGWAR